VCQRRVVEPEELAGRHLQLEFDVLDVQSVPLEATGSTWTAR
jgi:hypothetical protein